MVVGAFPLAKLGTLLLRQISKPIATIAKERAKKNHFFRTYICMPPAQFYNWCEVKAKMWILDLGKPTVVPTLNEAMAIELGANLLGEGIIFVIAAGVLVLEYMRSTRKESAKEEARRDEMDTLHYTIQELYFSTERQEAQIRELLRKVNEMESQVVMKPKWISPVVRDNTAATLDNIPALESDVQMEQIEHNPRVSSGVVLQALKYLQNESASWTARTKTTLDIIISSSTREEIKRAQTVNNHFDLAVLKMFQSRVKRGKEEIANVRRLLTIQQCGSIAPAAVKRRLGTADFLFPEMKMELRGLKGFRDVKSRRRSDDVCLNEVSLDAF